MPGPEGAHAVDDRAGVRASALAGRALVEREVGVGVDRAAVDARPRGRDCVRSSVVPTSATGAAPSLRDADLAEARVAAAGASAGGERRRRRRSRAGTVSCCA